MKWSELSDRDKVKLILEHVFGHYFVDDDSFTVRHRGDMPKDFHWPIAWWDSLVERWQTRDIASNWNTQFDPLHDMNDAMSALLQVGRRFVLVHDPNPVVGGIKFSCRIEPPSDEDELSAVGNADDALEAMNLATLRACGVEIEA